MTSRVTPGPEAGTPLGFVNYVSTMVFPRPMSNGLTRFSGFSQIAATRDASEEALPLRDCGTFRSQAEVDAGGARGTCACVSSECVPLRILPLYIDIFRLNVSHSNAKHSVHHNTTRHSRHSSVSRGDREE